MGYIIIYAHDDILKKMSEERSSGSYAAKLLEAGKNPGVSSNLNAVLENIPEGLADPQKIQE